MKTLEEIQVHPIFRALNPRGKYFLKKHKLSTKLNPHADRVNIFALTIDSFPHIKSVPAFEMMLAQYKAGKYEGKTTLVVPSSGNTAHGVARLAPAYGLDVKIVLSTDVSPGKKGILAALSSVKILEVPSGTQEYAIEEAKRNGHVLLDQYNLDAEANAESHFLHTGPAILAVFGGAPDIFAASMGSAGTVVGCSRYLKRIRPKTVVVGVRPAVGQQSPGTRDRKKMEAVDTLPYEEACDVIIESGGRKESFTRMRQLWSEVEPQPGPSSGLAFDGLLRYLEGSQAGGPGAQKLTAAFICPDDGRFYPEYTTSELDTHEGVIS
ncbi:MAG: pyridoxal-phosphate dependent enzyme [Minisyncoccia bacterium]